MLRRCDMPLLALAGFATAAPVIAVPAMFDQVVMPRLVLTAMSTGVVLVLCAAIALPALGPPSRGAKALVALVVLYIATLVLSTVAGVDPRGSLLGEFQRYQGLLPQLTYLLLMAATAWAVLGSRTVILLEGVFAGSVLAAGYAFLDLLGLDWIDWETRAAGRAGGMFAQPNSLGLLLAVGAIIGFGLWASAGSKARPVLAGLIALHAAMLVLTYSRGAWIGFGAGVLVWAALELRPSRAQALTASLLAATAVAGVAVFSPPNPVLDSAVARGASVIDVNDNSTRLGLWRVGLEMFADRPLIGAGPDGFSALFPQYREPDQPGIGTADVRPEGSHSVLIDHLVSVGLLGTIPLVGLAVLVVSMGIGVARRRNGMSRLTTATLAAFVVYLVATLFAFAEAMTGWLAWMLAGSLVGEWLRAGGAGPSQPARAAARYIVRLPGVLVGTALLVGSALLFVADLEAGRAARSPEAASAISHSERAARLNPLNRQYRLQLASLEFDLGRYGGAAAHFRRLNSDFAPTSHSLVSEAEALDAWDGARFAGEIDRLLAEAGRLDPHNVVSASRADELRRTSQNEPNAP